MSDPTHARKRVNRKQRLAVLLGSMRRADAIFPPLQDIDHELVLAVLLAHSVLADGAARAPEAAAWRTMCNGGLGLSASDVDYLVYDLTNRPLGKRGLDWLRAFLTSQTGAGQRAELIARMWRAALARGELRPSETAVAARLAELAGLSRADIAARLEAGQAPA